MNTIPLPSVFDANGLAAIKRQVKANDPAALKAAARQFEALFLQMVLKSMRDATPREGLFDSDQTRLYESLLDQQMSQVLASKGGTGLAKLIESQLSRNAEVEPSLFKDGLPLQAPAVPKPLEAPVRAMPLPSSEAVPIPLSSPSPVPAPPASMAGSSREFVGRIWPHAVEAGRSLGVPAGFLVAQAALETGWGRAEPRRADGQTSHNLFGIKAGRNWTGATVEATTTEYIDGIAQQRVERFRAYGSYAEAFRDYVSLLSSSSRYAPVLGATDASTFARGLQRAGYATDPGYADKLTRIIGGLASQGGFSV
jgi:peptidoglycan hydrolase FlgJ